MADIGAPHPSGLADRYAGALYGLASDAKSLDDTVAQMAALGRLIDNSAPFRAFLGSPLLDVAQSQRAALAVLDGQGFGKAVRDLVGVVAANRRLPSLRAIVAAFAALVAARRGVMVVEARSAHPLTDVQRASLHARLAEIGYGQVDLQERVDPSLLGGLVVKVGARLYDTSLKSRLQRLQHAMKEVA